ncbi:SU10 major capsid protein [Sinimarinibacterium flocculans]|uniref:SU10 major capsid protein n=1 Tax=Sinimarinibacterium flocculans TaxID=985250 RepID=UPI003518F658
MATYKTSDAVGEREELAAVIYRIDPTDTPIFSALKKEGARAVYSEWQVQELAAASATNYNNEGADYSYVNPSATTRMGNYHQISVKAASVSGTLDAVDKAGRDRETAYVKTLKGLELRRDIEKYLVSDVAKSSSDPRKAGTLSTWITNVSVAASSAAPTGDGTDVPTLSGTDRAMAISQIDAAMLAAFEDGGKPSIITMSPTNKQVFSNLSSASVATNQIITSANKDAAYVGAVSLYRSDFGELNVVVDRFQGNDRLFLLDTDYASITTLPNRNFVVSDVAPTGDATKFAILAEWSLKVSAPKAHAAVYDLTGA